MRSLFLSLCLLCFSVTAHAAGPALKSEEAYAMALFPQSAGWKLVSELPFPEELNDPKLAGELELMLQLSGELGSALCSERQSPIQALLERDGPGRMHMADLNGDGLPDIFYTGYSTCREGTSSLIWFATPSGSYKIEKNSEVRGKIVLLQHPEAERPPQFITWSPGCCGDSRDTYTIANIVDGGSWVRYANNWMLNPPGFLPGRHSGGITHQERLAVPGLLVLRLSPKIDDEYDHGFSDAWDIVSLGNIQAVYACQGIDLNNGATLLAWSEDGEWGLLALNAGHELTELFSTGYPDKVELGWAHKSQFRTAPEHDLTNPQMNVPADKAADARAGALPKSDKPTKE